MYRESIAVFQELEHKRGIARLLEAFACSEAEQARPERALRMAGAAAALGKASGFRLLLWNRASWIAAWSRRNKR